MINANETFGIETAKVILTYPVVNGSLELPASIFKGFGYMLYAVANPLSNCDKEAQEYIMQEAPKLGIINAKIV